MWTKTRRSSLFRARPAPPSAPGRLPIRKCSDKSMLTCDAGAWPLRCILSFAASTMNCRSHMAEFSSMSSPAAPHLGAWIAWKVEVLQKRRWSHLRPMQIWPSCNRRTPHEEYDRLAEQFASGFAAAKEDVARARWSLLAWPRKARHGLRARGSRGGGLPIQIVQSHHCPHEVPVGER